MTRIKNAFAVCALLVLAACATATPYQPAATGKGYGFSEQKIEENRYRITFRGNSSTTREMVENSLLYRAAELSILNGYDHFIMVENDTEAKTTYSTTTEPAFFGRYAYGYPGYYYAFPYYAYGWGWGSPYDSYTREITRYSAVAFVTMHKGAKPSDNPQAFDAREVMENLRPLVLGAVPAEY
ncbi:MAG: hypothetical protein RIE56_04720 [Amphiplicatus sp.]